MYDGGTDSLSLLNSVESFSKRYFLKQHFFNALCYYACIYLLNLFILWHIEHTVANMGRDVTVLHGNRAGSPRC